MKKILLTTFFALFILSSNSFGQEKGNSILFGYNSSWYRNVNNADENSLSIPGLFLGYQFDLTKEKRVDIETGINISTKGSRLPSIGDTYIENVLVYLELPILAKYELSKGSKLVPFLYSGPSINIKLASLNWTGPINNIRRIDFSIITGCGLRLNKFSLNARYSHGLLDFDLDENSGNLKNSTVSILVGYEF